MVLAALHLCCCSTKATTANKQTNGHDCISKKTIFTKVDGVPDLTTGHSLLTLVLGDH